MRLSFIRFINTIIQNLDGGFKYVLFSRLFREMIQFWRAYFSDGLTPSPLKPVQQPRARLSCRSLTTCFQRVPVSLWNVPASPHSEWGQPWRQHWMVNLDFLHQNPWRMAWNRRSLDAKTSFAFSSFSCCCCCCCCWSIFLWWSRIYSTLFVLFMVCSFLRVYLSLCVEIFTIYSCANFLHVSTQ